MASIIPILQREYKTVLENVSSFLIEYAFFLIEYAYIYHKKNDIIPRRMRKVRLKLYKMHNFYIQ